MTETFRAADVAALAELTAGLTRRGFVLADGGHGCQAFRRELPGGRYALVTDSEGCQLPDGGAALVGVYYAGPAGSDRQGWPDRVSFLADVPNGAELLRFLDMLPT